MSEQRLDAWYDGSAICLTAVGAHGDPLDLGDDEARADRQAAAMPGRVRGGRGARLKAQAGVNALSIATLARLMPLGCAYASARKAIKPAAW